jgi:hypothetical protein
MIKSEGERVESQTQRVEKWRTETVAPAKGTHRMAALRRHVYGSFGFKKSPWGVGTTMDFIRLEIWGFGIVQALEKLSFCGFIAEGLDSPWPLGTKQWQNYVNQFVGKRPPTSPILIRSSECGHMNLTIQS